MIVIAIWRVYTRGDRRRSLYIRPITCALCSRRHPVAARGERCGWTKSAVFYSSGRSTTSSVHTKSWTLKS